MSFEIGMLCVVIAAYVVIAACFSGMLLGSGIYGPKKFSSVIRGGLLWRAIVVGLIWPVGLLVGLPYSAKAWRKERMSSKRKGNQ